MTNEGGTSGLPSDGSKQKESEAVKENRSLGDRSSRLLKLSMIVTLECSQPTVSRVVTGVSDLLYRRRHEFITWPNQEEQRTMSRRFFDYCGIPNVVEALDDSPIKVLAPSESEGSYVNRHDPTRSAKTIMAACCMRNMCVATGECPFDEDEAIQQQYLDAGDENVKDRADTESDTFRRYIIEKYLS
ncbi:hypothetical protein ANCCEY_11510 [Ancylostoma ceylanicum]|uniref:DDE Tnp4 domain-containing protein n=1 Tax=Ancylostoma ceylanicum TaxID=53326 RepID=A0A0D6LHK4_9BILA|nr:hypothetical protein ANCCEY_11510 [Ancylostoma ceylanicum]